MPQSAANIQISTLTGMYLFIGPADSGKSYAATSWGYLEDPYKRPCYVMELDQRLIALKGRPVMYDEFNDTDGAVGVLNRLIELRERCIQIGRAPFHTIIVDSATSFLDFCMSDSLAITEESNKEARANNKDTKGRMRGELLLPTIEDYGYESEAIRKLLWENLSVLKKYCNVILTCHEVEYYRPVKVKPGEPTRSELAGYKPLARDKIAAKLPTKFDEIYHFLHKEVIMSTSSIRRQVVFQDQIARTSFPPLKKSIRPIDITDKEFYLMWKEMIENGS